MTVYVDVSRDAWLGAGTWLDDPAFPGWGAIELVIIHWPGANGVPWGVHDDPADVFDYLRGQQSMYVNDPDRGYNLGYNFAVDWLGRRIEVRGDTAKNAANAPGELNGMSLSIEVLTNLDGAMTPEQVTAVASLCGQIQGHAPDAVVIGHRDGPLYVDGATATACPGDAIHARILNGEFDPPPEDDMALTDEDIDRIAQRVWEYTMQNIPAGTVVPARDLLQGAYRDANGAYKNTVK